MQSPETEAQAWADRNPHDRDQRCTGRTTMQMQEAPRNAIFVWCTRELEYPRSVARQIGRLDLDLKTPAFFDRTGHHWRGLVIPALVVDHAAFGFFTKDQKDGYFRCMTQLESRKK